MGGGPWGGGGVVVVGGRFVLSKPRSAASATARETSSRKVAFYCRNRSQLVGHMDKRSREREDTYVADWKCSVLSKSEGRYCSKARRLAAPTVAGWHNLDPIGPAKLVNNLYVVNSEGTNKVKQDI